MTEQELFDLWERWMHRNDMTADMPTVYSLSKLRVQERMLLGVTIEDVLANAPRTLVHAGLSYLHEIAQDAEGKTVEDMRFEEAIKDYSFALSRQESPTINAYDYGVI